MRGNTSALLEDQAAGGIGLTRCGHLVVKRDGLTIRQDELAQASDPEQQGPPQDQHRSHRPPPPPTRTRLDQAARPRRENAPHPARPGHIAPSPPPLTVRPAPHTARDFPYLAALRRDYPSAEDPHIRSKMPIDFPPPLA